MIMLDAGTKNEEKTQVVELGLAKAQPHNSAKIRAIID